jgi:hypothetical protein
MEIYTERCYVLQDFRKSLHVFPLLAVSCIDIIYHWCCSGILEIGIQDVVNNEAPVNNWAWVLKTIPVKFASSEMSYIFLRKFQKNNLKFIITQIILWFQKKILKSETRKSKTMFLYFTIKYSYKSMYFKCRCAEVRNSNIFNWVWAESVLHFLLFNSSHKN